MASSGHESIETEAKLVIVSDAPEKLIEAVAALSSIAGYNLVPADCPLIDDSYFDTPKGDLAAYGLGLRVRHLSTEVLITLKGPSRTTDWGGLERLEIELPWTKTNVRRIFGELSDRGMRLSVPDPISGLSDPQQFMEAAGLELIQHRATRRVLRDVISPDTSEVLAELALDTVVYRVSHVEIHHHEIEIESKQDDGATAIQAVLEHLTSSFGGVMRRWHHGKLTMGRAIEKAWKLGLLHGLIGTGHNLIPAAYDVIDHILAVL